MSTKDRINITKEVDKDGNESISYRKSWDKKGMHYSVEVKKVEGGYIIVEEKYGTPDNNLGDEKGEYISERTERVSIVNPFASDDKENSEAEKMFSWVDKPTF